MPRTPGSAPAGPLTLDVHPRGALFLRADRLEGTRTEVTAQGGVELRAREALLETGTSDEGQSDQSTA